MITWGISANSHDAALAVFDNRDLVFASHSERFSGVKNDAHLNEALIQYAWNNYGSAENIVWYERPLVKSFRQLWARQGFKFKENNIRNYLASHHLSMPFTTVDHHHSHAAGGYYTSGFDNAAVVCIDSIGEFETLTIWHGQGNELTKVYSQRYPHSVGLWYSAMTQRIGLKPNEDEYILMGMAAYGNPKRFYKIIKEDFFKTIDHCEIKFKNNLHRGCIGWRNWLRSEQDRCDIAAAVQKIYEEILDSILAHTRERLPSNNLVLSGGCALNCSANNLAFKYYGQVWIMPNPGDAGSAVGAVLADKQTHIEWPGPYLGYNIEGDYPVDDLVHELTINSIVGIANGKAEYGPRALGNRSLLADPRDKNIKQRVNDIKQRQQFRPFAPAILAEFAQDYFEGSKGPYMQFTAKCKYPHLYPAVVHADGTSRVQTVSKSDNPGFRRLLEAWHKRTGCPMLLNTSLNIKGKPMVNTRDDAVQFYKQYGVKVL